MSVATNRRIMAAMALLAMGCRQRSAPDETTSVVGAATAAMACAADSLYPATAPPAAGLWVGNRNAPPTRVAAMIGPASADGDRARITRRVETLELRGASDSLRLETDTASARLALLPPFVARAESADTTPAGASTPASVYAIGSQVLLAAYEPCAASPAESRIRYLRRDDRGGVAIDLMLRRESSSAAGAIP
jgi:hypothetical protein